MRRHERYTARDKLGDLLILLICAGVLYVYNPGIFKNIRSTVKSSGNALKTDATDYSNTAVNFNLTESDGTVQNIQIPQYDGTSLSYTVNDDTPYFTDSDFTVTSEYLSLSELDQYGRAGQANAVVNENALRKGDRADISSIHPSGWYEAKESTIPIQRCHLIGSMIADGISETKYGTNAVGTDETTNDPKNMVSGSQALNSGSSEVDGSMLEYEKQIIQAEEDGLTIRYRVTPVFEDNDATCHGVLMEAESIGDSGAALKICEYIYNVQPGYVCNYRTGLWEELVDNG